MKTKYNPSFIVLGVFIALGLGSQISRYGFDLGSLIVVIIAVLFLGYGIKLRRLAKKGIADTKDIK